MELHSSGFPFQGVEIISDEGNKNSPVDGNQCKVSEDDGVSDFLEVKKN